jgi:polyketide synthase 12
MRASSNVFSGPPPLGPSAQPLDRLIAFGHARLRFPRENQEIARTALDGRAVVPFGPSAAMTPRHIRMPLTQLSVEGLTWRS